MDSSSTLVSLSGGVHGNGSRPLERGAATLAREERLVLEALDAELRYDGPAAEETLRALVRFYPDDLEYLLALARVQAGFGNPKGALATLTPHAPDGGAAMHDQRIELAIAETYGKLGDAPEQRKHAEASVVLATGRGARGLAALASLEVLSARVSIEGGRAVLDDFEGAAKRLEDLGQTSAALRASSERAYQLWRGGRHDDARRAALEIRERARVKRDRFMEGRATQILGLSLQLTDRAAALAAHEEALATFRAIGDKRATLNPLVSLGILNERAGHLAAAIALFDEVLGVARRIGSQREESRALTNLADAHYRALNLDRAIESVTAARPLYLEMGDQSGYRYATISLAGMQVERGDLERTEALDAEAEKLFASVGADQERGNWLLVVSAAREYRGDFAGARSALDKALKIYEEQESAEFAANVQLALASMAVDERRPNSNAARAVVERAHARDAPDFECEANGVLVQALALEGQAREVERAIADADKACNGLEIESSRNRAQIAIGSALAHLGRARDARARLDPAIEQTAKGGFVVRNLEARIARLETTPRRQWTPVEDGAAAEIERECVSRGLRLYADLLANLKSAK